MSADIDEEWLGAVAGKALFYPAAGADMPALVEAFTPHIRDFHFNDLFYSNGRDRVRAAPPNFQILSSERPDPSVRDERIETRSAGSRTWRHVNPSVLIERLADQQVEIVIRRRRGFGQYALAELQPRSIGVFVHRRDSRGESGSDAWFLANKRRSHEPLSRLWDKLSVRLADRAIIVSDGSLTSFSFLRAVSSKAVSTLPIEQRGGFEWRCIGRMTDDRGGLVWGVSRQ